MIDWSERFAKFIPEIQVNCMRTQKLKGKNNQNPPMQGFISTNEIFWGKSC
jgi:hypothetical protein